MVVFEEFKNETTAWEVNEDHYRYALHSSDNVKLINGRWQEDINTDKNCDLLYLDPTWNDNWDREIAESLQRFNF
jgi:hypothetical protein